jgi:hypothetical protein
MIQGVSPHQTLNLPVLDLDFPSFRTLRNQFLLLTVAFYYSSPNRLRQVVMTTNKAKLRRLQWWGGGGQHDVIDTEMECRRDHIQVSYLPKRQMLMLDDPYGPQGPPLVHSTKIEVLSSATCHLLRVPLRAMHLCWCRKTEDRNSGKMDCLWALRGHTEPSVWRFLKPQSSSHLKVFSHMPRKLKR